MPKIKLFVQEKPAFDQNPFPHFTSSKIFDVEVEKLLLNWFNTTDLWSFTQTSFYMQYEFSLFDLELPKELSFLTEPKTIERIKGYFEEIFATVPLDLVGITAHKLTDGCRMGVHNDFIGKAETHRLIIQINNNWQQANGGFLMLFNSDNPKDVSKVVQPLNNSCLGFEISPKSYHAVSTVYNFSRYTLVYTFNKSIQ